MHIMILLGIALLFERSLRSPKVLGRFGCLGVRDPAG